MPHPQIDKTFFGVLSKSTRNHFLHRPILNMIITTNGASKCKIENIFIYILLVYENTVLDNKLPKNFNVPNKKKSFNSKVYMRIHW